MKKLVVGTLALATLGMMVINGSTAQADTTKVEYSVEGDYTLVIPQTVNLLHDNTTEMSIKTINRNLAPGKEVEITISNGLSADGEIELQRTASVSDVLTSSIKSNNAPVLITNPVIGSFTGYATAETEVSKVEFGVPQGQQLAGSYSTTLTFAAAYK